MNIAIFLTIYGIGFISLIIGYASKGEADILKFLGYAIMFMNSLILFPLVPGELEFKTGETHNLTVTSNTTQTTVVADSYSTYEDFFIAFMLSVVFGCGFATVFIDLRNDK